MQLDELMCRLMKELQYMKEVLNNHTVELWDTQCSLEKVGS
jgi:hypothetical protein